MLVVGNRRYKKQYVIGGAGIFDSILQFLIRTFTSQTAKEAAVVARSKAINYLHLVAATIERHDRNSGRRPVELSLLPFISQATSGV